MKKEKKVAIQKIIILNINIIIKMALIIIEIMLQFMVQKNLFQNQEKKDLVQKSNIRKNLHIKNLKVLQKLIMKKNIIKGEIKKK